MRLRKVRLGLKQTLKKEIKIKHSHIQKHFLMWFSVNFVWLFLISDGPCFQFNLTKHSLPCLRIALLIYKALMLLLYHNLQMVFVFL